MDYPKPGRRSHEHMTVSRVVPWAYSLNRHEFIKPSALPAAAIAFTSAG